MVELHLSHLIAMQILLMQILFYGIGFLILIYLVLFVINLCLKLLEVITSFVLSAINPNYRRHQRLKRKLQKIPKHGYHAKASQTKSPGYAGLWHQLLIKTRFDIPTAERLVASCKLRHPFKSDRWCIEKCIRDLERDRR
jgi:hypothetical protein